MTEEVKLGDLTKNFSRKEFICPCCGKSAISMRLVNLLQDMREVVGPICIDSGFRCEKYNSDSLVGGMENSAHLRGLAVDVRVLTSSMRYDLLCMIPSRFRRFGVYKTWIHVDIDESLDQDVMWVG